MKEDRQRLWVEDDKRWSSDRWWRLDHPSAPKMWGRPLDRDKVCVVMDEGEYLMDPRPIAWADPLDAHCRICATDRTLGPEADVDE